MSEVPLCPNVKPLTPNQDEEWMGTDDIAGSEGSGDDDADLTIKNRGAEAKASPGEK